MRTLPCLPVSARAPRAAGALLLLASLALRPSHAVAQPRDRIATDSLIRAAVSLTHTGDTAQALELLNQATDQSPKDPEALYWRGLMIARTSTLGFGSSLRNYTAMKLLDRAAELDPKNPRYLLEMGRVRLTQPLLRVEAERLFRKALKVAESNNNMEQLAEVTWELGQVKERRYRSSNNRYMITSIGLFFEPGQVFLQKYYTKEFLTMHSRPIEGIGTIDRSEAEEYYRRGLRALPTHEPNAIGLLGLLYDQRRYQEMREVARPFLESNTGSARLRLGAGLAAYRMGEPALAERMFNEALERMTSAARNDALDLSRIIRRNDALTYNALSTESRAGTDSAYWEAADPLLSTPENEGRLEFLARLALADLRFSDVDMRQTGWRTDRGLILLRYGEPPVEATFAPVGQSDAWDAAGRITTVWYYPGNERTFAFSGPPAMNYASFYADMKGLAEEQREDAPFLLDNVPFAVAVDTLPVQVARFRGKSPDRSQLVVAAAVRTKSLYDSVEIDRGSMALSLRVGPPSRMALAKADTVDIRLPAAPSTRRVWSETVPHGRTRVRVEAQDRVVRGAARGQVELDVRPPSNGLEVSDFLFIEKYTAPQAPLTGFLESGAVARGDAVFSQREAFSLYWEHYGLQPDAAGRVKADVQIRVTMLDIDRSGQSAGQRLLMNVVDAIGLTTEGEEQLGLRFTREESLAGRDRLPQTITVGMGSAPAGRYRLEVIVTDPATKRTARTAREFRLTR